MATGTLPSPLDLYYPSLEAFTADVELCGLLDSWEEQLAMYVAEPQADGSVGYIAAYLVAHSQLY